MFDINDLNSGSKWASTTITFSFPTAQTSHWGEFNKVDNFVNLYDEVINVNNYFWNLLNKAETHYGGVSSIVFGVKDDAKLNLYSDTFSPLQINSTKQVLNEWQSVANISFIEVGETWDAHTYTHWTLEPIFGYEVGRIWSSWGQIRFANTNTPNAPESAGLAYYPPIIFNGLSTEENSSGDVWLNTTFDEMKKDNLISYSSGGSAFKTLIHEVGHALGLSHPFDNGNVKEGDITYLKSVMDYSNGLLIKGTNDRAYPTTPMPYDIKAIQLIYGPNTIFNSIDNNFEYYQNTPYFETIYDTGGYDTLTWNGTDPAHIDLNPGAYSDLSNLGNSGRARTVAIYETSIIENARGGDGGDVIIGNDVSNYLDGREGNDKIYGNSGSDILYGNNGNDCLNGGIGNDYLWGGEGQDQYVFDNSLNSYNYLDTGEIATIMDFRSTDGDLIVLDPHVMKNLDNGWLSTEAFQKGTSDIASEVNDRIIYNTISGNLFYDADGIGPINGILFAKVGTDFHAELTNNNFWVGKTFDTTSNILDPASHQRFSKYDGYEYYGGNNIDSLSYPDFQVNGIEHLKDGSWKVTSISDSSTNIETIANDIERLEFSNSKIALDTLSPTQSAGAVVALWYALYDQLPDSNALGRWILSSDELYDNNSIDQNDFINLADLMLQSYNFNNNNIINNIDLVTRLYTNIVGSVPSQDDLNYFVQLIETGVYTQAGIFSFGASHNLNALQYVELVGNGLYYNA